ncbi:MAG: class I SAM-dependent methyltransferase, partial [Acidimicrobiia bacterium]
ALVQGSPRRLRACLKGHNSVMSWSDLSDWWLAEIEEDPAYEAVVNPMLLDVLRPERGRTYLDLGCGEGRVMRAMRESGAIAHGVERNPDLARRAADAGPVVIGRLPELAFLRDHSYDGAFCVLVLEHIEDEVRLLAEAARVVRPGGLLALVMNHPYWTAPGATPISDLDGETLWRPGDYFTSGTTLEPAGENEVLFHHRTTARVLETAAAAGWSLERFVEAPHHELVEQPGIPRLLACRWRLLP